MWIFIVSSSNTLCIIVTFSASLYNIKCYLLLSLFVVQALSRTLTEDELYYMKEQFALLEPNKNGTISLESIKAVGFLQKNLIKHIFSLEYMFLNSLYLSGFDEICN